MIGFDVIHLAAAAIWIGGIAGLVVKGGVGALWYAVGFTAGYLLMLTLVAAPLRRTGALTAPDFAEARLGSAFDIKAFHDAVLDSGPMPLRLLDEVVASRLTG